MASLGATLKVAMDTSAVKRGLAGIKASFSKLGGVLRVVGRAMRKAVLPVAGALGAVAAAAFRTASFATELRHEMERTGQTAHGVLKIREAFRTAGIDIEKTKDAVFDMQEGLEDFRFGGTPDVGVALDRLKIAFSDIYHLGPEDQLNLIMSKIQESTMTVQQTAWAVDKLFKGAGQEMVALSRNWKVILKDAEESTKSLAGSIGGTNLDDIRTMQVSIGRLRSELVRVGFELLRAVPIDKLADVLNAINSEAIIGALAKFSEGIKWVLSNPGEALAKVWEKLAEFATKFADILAKAIGDKLKGLLPFSRERKTAGGPSKMEQLQAEANRILMKIERKEGASFA